MSNVVSAEATVFSATYPDIVKRTDVASVMVSAALGVAAMGAFAVALRMGDSSSIVSMLLMTGGTVLFLLSVFRLFWRSKKWVYAPTGSAVKEGNCFFGEDDLPELTDVLAEHHFTGMPPVKAKSNGKVRMDYMLSEDKCFVAIQLFRFVPYTYEPASPVFCLTEEEAAAFARYLKAGKG